jgi:hypothetical protein
MTPEQLAALGAYIAATPALNAYPQNSDGAFEIAALLNLPADPAFYVWRNEYTPEQMRAAVANGITQLDALTASKRDSLLWFVQGTVDASQPAVRAAFNDLTGSQNTLKAAITDGAKRVASLAEKVLSTGTGTFAVPATASFVGTVSYQDVMAARAA